LAAAEIVAEALGGTFKSRDGVDAAEGMHDFDISVAGRLIALEVTTATDAESVQLSDRAYGKKGNERKWPAPELAHNWVVVIGSALRDVRGVVRDMRPILRVFEEHGTPNIDTRIDPAYAPLPADTPIEVAEARSQMFNNVRVKAAHDIGPPQAGEAEIFLSISAGVWGDIEKVNALVVERAQPKAAKLAKANADETHLFVWLDGTQPGAELATATGPPPESAPAVPSEIDVVWLATPPVNDARLVWRVRPPDGWEVLK
jgi:hypothetical protein